MQANDAIVTNSEDMSNAFSIFLSNIGQALSAEFQTDSNYYSSYNNVLSSAVFQFQSVTEDDLN